MMMIAALTFTLASSTFKPDTTVPKSMVCTQLGGGNVSPELHWSGAPKGTKSFALVVHDPDAPHPGGWYHWIAYDIPASQLELPAGHAAASSGPNSGGRTGYAGMCPPPGKVHHYHFNLYALDTAHFESRVPMDAGRLMQRIHGHVLAHTVLTGLYESH